MSNFCISCGAALRPTVKFCTSCGVGVAEGTETGAGFEADIGGTTPQAVDADASSEPTSKMPWIIGGSVLALLVAYAIFMAFFAPKKSEAMDGADAAMSTAAAAASTNPAITGQAADMYIVADANVRDQPTAQGSSIVTKLMRGTKINGTLQIGADGTSAWMKLTDGTGYIGAVNLNTNAPPKLAKAFADMKWNVEESTDLLATPDANSAVVAHLNMRDQTTLAGVTENGFAEAKRSKGGVGYFLVTGSNDRTGALAVDGVTAAGAATLPVESGLGEDNPTPDYMGVADGQKMKWRKVLEGQDIVIELGGRMVYGPGDGQNQVVGAISYRNMKTGKSCSSHLVYSGKEENWFGVYRQIVRSDDTPCPYYALVKMGAGHEGMRYFSWWRDGKEIMGDSFE